MSRDLQDLTARTRDRATAFLAIAAERGLSVLIYCTRRSCDEQARLYRRGRALRTIQAKAEELTAHWRRPDLGALLMEVGPQYGRRVTNAAPGQSAHNYGVAFDCVPLVDGKPVWGARDTRDRTLWRLLGETGEEAGLEWSGRWTRFREYPHFQEPGFAWRERIQGAKL